MAISHFGGIHGHEYIVTGRVDRRVDVLDISSAACIASWPTPQMVTALCSLVSDLCVTVVAASGRHLISFSSPLNALGERSGSFW
jgi:hypothetical protein